MMIALKAGFLMEYIHNANGLFAGQKSIIRLAGRVLLFLMAGCFLSGCGQSELSQIERIMESDVQKADSMIQSMKEPSSKRNQALYSLLKTQIDYKMYRDADSDSLVRIATDYYGRKYKGYHAAMAWYSLGCISAELGNDSTAADAYLSALSLFPDTLVRYYALAEQNLSYIFLEHNMDDEAIQLIKSCRLNACRLADSAAIAFCDYNIAKYYLLNNLFDTAKVLFEKLADNNWLSSDTKDYPLLHIAKIFQLDKQNYEQSIEYVDLFINRKQNRTVNNLAYSIKADAYYDLHLFDSARHYYAIALNEPIDPYTTCDAFRRLSEIHSIKGNSDSAAYYAEKASAWMDTIVVSSSSNTIFRSLLSNAQLFTPQEKSIATALVLLLLTLSIIFFIGIVLHSRPKGQIHQIENISDFENDLIDFKQSQIYQEMIFAINEKKEIESKQKNALIDKFRESLPELRAFIAASSNVNGNELDYCIYTMLGFKQKDYHKIFNLSQSGCRNLKSRINGKMPEDIFRYIFDKENPSYKTEE